MNRPPFFALTFALSALVSLLHAATPAIAASDEVFNLEARKQKQPWLWHAPQREKIPAVRNQPWPRNPIDAFILARLETTGLTPAPPTDDRTWLRRVHFVITGLPPSPEEIQALLADRRPGARERVVEQLLASPHFGERWARHWMDLMRYAESRGHEGDYIIANAWRYRDYLIRAFNEDVPYDQFLMEHLAGDLLPQPRLRPGTESNESVLATGWAFLGEENHSPVDIRQDECERIDNKVDVFSKTFLGLTVSCARCHDHKFDPIRAQDYYALSGFFLGSSFRQVRFEAMENNKKLGRELAGLRERFIPQVVRSTLAGYDDGILNSAAYLVEASEVLAVGQRDSTERRSSAPRAVAWHAARLQRWVDQLQDAGTNHIHLLHQFTQLRPKAERDRENPHAAESLPSPGLPTLSASPTSSPLPTGSIVLADYCRAAAQPWKADGEAFGARPVRAGEVILGHDATAPLWRVMTYGAAQRDLFWNRLKTAPGNENDSGRLAATARSGQMLCTPTMTLGVGKLHYLIKGRTLVYAAVDSHLMVEGPLHGRLVEKFDSGTAIEPRWVTHDLSAYSGHRVHVEFGPDGPGALEVLLVVEAAEQPQWRPAVRPFESKREAQSKREFAQEFQDALATAIQRLRSGTLSQGADSIGQAALAQWLVQNPSLFRDEPDSTVSPVAHEFFVAQSNLARRVRWESPTAVAWFDGTGVDENVLLRGKPFRPGVVSPRNLPAAFGDLKPITTVTSSGRYELAQELIAPTNPLVARTIVNRVWHHVFGRGIVASVDNFGALGDRPSHPELLDYLAWQFVNQDHWSLKHLIQRLVLTQTFALSSRADDPRAAELDPANALLHRMPVRRLEGEAIRDALLAVSGRLNPAVGGPPEPIYLTEFLVGRGRPEKSGPLDGDGRRSIYAVMHRNFLPTLMQTFDAPTPFSTVGKRNVTNVPAQSLALMNDELFHQQARVWAERLLRETAGRSREDRIRWLFETAYGREPAVTETEACVESLAELRQLHAANAPAVETWSDLCHALLNANDFIYVK